MNKDGVVAFIQLHLLIDARGAFGLVAGAPRQG